MICFVYDLRHERSDRNRLHHKPAELRRQHADLPDLQTRARGRVLASNRPAAVAF